MEDRIKKVMSEVLGLDIAKINKDTSVDTVDTWDSLRQMNLIVALEDEFDFEFDEDEMTELTGFTIIVNSVSKKVACR